MKSINVLIGSGAIGVAIARRVSAGRHLLIADVKHENAEAAATKLQQAGFDVSTATVDVTSKEDVKKLAQKAANLGDVMGVIHSAGVSPTQAPIDLILKVDLLGTAHVLEEFGAVIAKAGAGIVVSSQAGHRIGALSDENAHKLAMTTSTDLLSLKMLEKKQITDSLHAYQLAKKGSSLRVMSEAVKWGEKGARLNAISPGIVTSPLSQEELEGPNGEIYRSMIKKCPAKRVGTPDEIANMAALLMGSEGGFITGADILMDGGVTSSYKYGDLEL
ncbi:MAG: SDR family oxidoreductase [Bdellovibrionales bacterium]|nr:SDR family oxidoreductase [Bdellovibrionales bacterium]